MSNSETRRAPRNFSVNGKCFKGVSCFSYLGALVSNDDNIRLSIRERIQAGNRAYFANINIFKTILVEEV